MAAWPAILTPARPRLEGVFVGGDAATGADTVIAAVASGRKAAVSD